MKRNLFFLIIGLIAGSYFTYKLNKIDKNLEEIRSVVSIVNQNFLGNKEYDKEKLYSYAIKGVVEYLEDKYSAFLTKDELKEEVNELNASYVGLGFEATKEKDKYLEILNVFLDSPAFKAGLVSGDKIIEIDDKDTKPMLSKETLSLIKGEEASQVKLKVKRDENIFTVYAVREKINSKIIDSKILENNIAYISLTQFPRKISVEFENTLNELKAKGMKKLILDLRGNGGGEISEVTPIASFLVPDEKDFLFSIDYKGFKEVDFSRDKKQIFDGDIVILVNSSTASAAELLTAILKDYKRATVIGEKTFGKAIIQQFFYLNSGNILKLTTGKYISPNREEINKIGLTPDINQEMEYLIAKTAYINETDKENKLRMKNIKKILAKKYKNEALANKIIFTGDTQLKKAIEYLQK